MFCLFFLFFFFFVFFVFFFFFFFFQAEDGIRDGTVTGVQTCALPICRGGRGGGRWPWQLLPGSLSLRNSAPRRRGCRRSGRSLRRSANGARRGSRGRGRGGALPPARRS